MSEQQETIVSAMGELSPEREGIFDCYTYNEAGKILSTGRQQYDCILFDKDRGVLIGLGEVDIETQYVDRSNGSDKLRARPGLDRGFDKTSLAPREEAVLLDVPPGSVTFTGPVSGAQPHDAFGPVRIGWTIPGEYRVTVSAFPYMPATFTLTVGN